MIAKVVRGYRPAGLLAYLFGPGRFEEHRNPRVVASWDGAPWLHQPDPLLPVVLDGEVVQPGEFDRDLRPLTRTMQQWPKLAGLPLSGPPPLPPDWQRLLAEGRPLPADAPGWAHCYAFDPKAGAVMLRPGYVWHCPVRLHPDDPVLTDEQWRHIGERLMGAVGIQQAGCRWIAVRHADDHIHLMATLVSETTGKRFHPYRDYLRLREECRRLEHEYGLMATAPADKTARPAPTRAEQAKAQRRGRTQTAREELWRIVSQYAATTSNAGEFLAELRSHGLDPRTVVGSDGQVCGYSVALPRDVTARGERLRYSGRSLAPDLSWPKLVARWAGTPAAPPVDHNEHGRVSQTGRRAAIQHAATVVAEAAGQARQSDVDLDGVAYATGQLLAALARGRHGSEPGPFADLACRYDRAARSPHSVLPRDLGPVALELRRAARYLGAVGALSGRGDEKLATAALLLALAGLVTEIAAWQQLRHRPHQATAARTTAAGLTTLGQANSDRRLVTRPTTIATPPIQALPERPAIWRGAGTHQQHSPTRRR